MMTRRQQRRFLQQFQAQVEQERNGAPIPGEIAARMTKPKVQQPLFQVVVTTKSGGDRFIPFAPMMLRGPCDELCSVINGHIAAGKERTITSAAVVPLTPLSTGV